MRLHPEDPNPGIVLYVEDQPVNVALMQALFRRRPDLTLVVATSGAEARRRAAGLEPALMLLDLGLPDCRGDELLADLRQLRGCRDVTAIAVTAEHEFDIRGTGFAELWSKPLNLMRVLERLDALVGPAGWRPAPRPSQAQPAVTALPPLERLALRH
jgi:CheY-like chemotaxis protein